MVISLKKSTLIVFLSAVNIDVISSSFSREGVPPPIYKLFISGWNSLFRNSIYLIKARINLSLDFKEMLKWKSQ